MAQWNLWHGCHKISPGCANCYVYRMDAKYQRDSSQVCKTSDFDLPARKNRFGEYKIPSGEVLYTCFTSDFFLEDADPWRPQAWEMMRRRQDLHFLFITKRIHRFYDAIPSDWGDGYENVTICCTTENQDRADFRLPIFLEAPIRHKQIVCEPLLGPIDLSRYLGGWIEGLVAGGESGEAARLCRFEWLLSLPPPESPSTSSKPGRGLKRTEEFTESRERSSTSRRHWPALTGAGPRKKINIR